MAVQVILTGDGLNYEKEASVVQAAQIIGFLNNDAPQTADVGAMSQGVLLEQPKASAQVSARGRLLETGAKTNAHKILVLGDYILNRDGIQSFPINDVKSAFNKAGEPLPRNFSRDLKEAVRLNYIFEDEEQSDHYVISNKGLELLENGFSTELKTAYRKSRGHQSPAAKTSAVRDEVAELPFNDILDGYPNYHALHSKTDKSLWILLFSKTNGVDGLSGGEITFISQKLSDHIPNGQIAGAMRTPMSKAYVSKISATYRILHSGQEYLKTKYQDNKGE